MKAVRKRAPGGGKKSSGEFTTLDASLTIRIRSDMREQLEAAAARNGRKISQEVQSRLKTTLIRDSNEQAPTTRALAFLVSYLAEETTIVIDGKSFDFRQDRTVFNALRLALEMLLARLEPKETPLEDFVNEGQMHDTWKEFLRSPEDIAKQVFRDIWDYLEVAKPFATKRSEDDLTLKWSRLSYALTKLREDLRIQEDRQ